MKVFYLAGAYESLPEEVAIDLHRGAARFLIKEGYSVISPIMHAKGILAGLDDNALGEFWLPLEERLICSADAICVIITANAFISEGVKREIELGMKMNKPIIYIIPTKGTFEILTHYTSVEEMFRKYRGLDDLSEEEVEEKCLEEEQEQLDLEEKSHQQEMGTSISLGKLLGKLKIGQE